MADLPPIVWTIVGIFITVVSIFLGIIKPVDHNSFFIMMIFFGVGMIIYGFIKGKMNEKTLKQKFEERRMQRPIGPQEVTIDQHRQRGIQGSNIQQTRAPQQYSQQAQHAQTHHSAQHSQHTSQHPQQSHHAYHTHPAQQAQKPAKPVDRRFCHQCGSPLQKHHKYCPVCGARA